MPIDTLHALPVKLNKTSQQYEASCRGCDQLVAVWLFEQYGKQRRHLVPRAILHDCPGRTA